MSMSGFISLKHSALRSNRQARRIMSGTHAGFRRSVLYAVTECAFLVERVSQFSDVEGIVKPTPAGRDKPGGKRAKVEPIIPEILRIGSHRLNSFAMSRFALAKPIKLFLSTKNGLVMSALRTRKPPVPQASFRLGDGSVSGLAVAAADDLTANLEFSRQAVNVREQLLGRRQQDPR